MAINYAKKYQKAIDQVYTQSSFTKPAFGASFEFTGANTATVYSLVTQAMADYSRTGANRYGTPAEVQDTVKDYTITKDRAFASTIDKGNYIQQNLVKTTGAYIKAQMNEVVTPEMDKYALTVLLAAATAVSQVPTPAAVTKTNAYEVFLKLNEFLDNASIPPTDRIAFCTPAYYNFIKQDSSFVLASEKGMSIKMNGLVGEVDGAKLIKAPSSYFPTNTALIITHPGANVFPMQIETIKTHEDPPGINGALIEGRFLYDAFVMENKRRGCAAWKTA